MLLAWILTILATYLVACWSAQTAWSKISLWHYVSMARKSGSFWQWLTWTLPDLVRDIGGVLIVGVVLCYFVFRKEFDPGVYSLVILIGCLVGTIAYSLRDRTAGFITNANGYDANWQALMHDKERLLKELPEGTYVVYIGGCLVTSGLDLKLLNSEVRSKYPNKTKLVYQLFRGSWD